MADLSSASSFTLRGTPKIDYILHTILTKEQLKSIYLQIFSEEDDRIVLGDLAHMSSVYRSNFIRQESNYTAFNESMRALFLYICSQLQRMIELIILKEKGVIDMEKYLDPTNDSLFKKIFRDKENLKEFLNSVLDLSEMYRIKEIEFIPVEELAGIHRGRRSVFDLKVKDASGNWYIIEMQKKNEIDYLKRVQYYSAHSYVQQLTEGLTHFDLLPVMVISLVKTRIFDKKVPYISIHKNIETTTNKQYLFDLSYVFIELGKFKKTKLTSVADEWLHLFKCATQETEPPKDIKSSKVLDAYHMIERYKLTPAEYDLYVRTKLQEDAEELALEENFNNGKAERSIEIAKEMLKEGYPIETINKLTKLSIEEIEVLRENLVEDTTTVLDN